MSSLGKIILKTLQSFYPHSNIKLTTEDIDGILSRANINKNNSNKEDISKIIKILKHHIEISQQNPKPIITEQKYTPNFTDMDKDNNYLDKMKLDYLDNFTKIQEKDRSFVPIETDILPPALRVKELMEEKEMEFEHYIIIDSKDRNKTLNTSACDYTIKLGISDANVEGSINRHFEEVVSIELVSFMMRHTFGVNNATDKLDVPAYLYLEIADIGSNLEGTQNFINKTFARLTYYELVDHGATKYRHYTIQRGDIIKYFKPRKNITRLSIRILDPNGNLYSYGDSTENAGETLNCFTFCVTTLQKNLMSNFIDKT